VNLAAVARGRLRLARNTLFRRAPATGPRARHALLGLALALVLAGILFGGMRTIFAWVAESGAGAGAAAGLLGLLLTAGLAGLLVFDLQEAINVLLLDSDLELLRRAPLSAREVFALKLADALARTSTLLAVFLLPALLAYAAVYPLPPWGWAIVPLELAGLWAIPLGLGVALGIAVISRVPVKRAREVLGLLSTLTLLLVWFANAFMLPRLATSDEPVPQAIARLMAAPPPWAMLLPSTWAARALAAAASHDAGSAALATLALALAGALALGLAAWAATRGLEAAQARVAAPIGRRRARGGARATGRAREAASARPALTRAGGPARRPGAWAAILRRDARLLFRDWTVLSDVLVSAALWTLFPLVGLSLHAPSTPGLMRAMLVTLAVALGYEVAARSLPFEREGGAWRQLAPVPPARWAAAKLAGAAAIAAPIVLAASVALALVFRVGVLEWLRVLCLALPALGLALALGLVNGATFGNPRWTDPRAMLGLAGRLIALLLLAVQLAMWFAAYLAAHALAEALPPGADFYGPTVLGALLAVAPFFMAVRRLDRMEWAG
jgi:hypothetical protein